MSGQDMFEAFGNIDERFIEEAREEKRPKARPRVVAIAGIAACFTLCLSVAFAAGVFFENTDAVQKQVADAVAMPGPQDMPLQSESESAEQKGEEETGISPEAGQVDGPRDYYAPAQSEPGNPSVEQEGAGADSEADEDVDQGASAMGDEYYRIVAIDLGRAEASAPGVGDEWVEVEAYAGGPVYLVTKAIYYGTFIEYADGQIESVHEALQEEHVILEQLLDWGLPAQLKSEETAPVDLEKPSETPSEAGEKGASGEA